MSWRARLGMIACLFAPMIVTVAASDAPTAQLIGFRANPTEFPKLGSLKRVVGELVSVNFILRTGQFRVANVGALVDFRMMPYGAINYLGAEADLREIPLGASFEFLLMPDAAGEPKQMVLMRDRFSVDAADEATYRVDAVNVAEGKISATRRSVARKQESLGKIDWSVTPETRIWKGDKPAKLADIAAGDDLRVNLAGPGTCSDIWIGTETQTKATDEQRKKFVDFLKTRGVPAWIDKVEGSTLTFTLFSGDPLAFAKSFMEGTQANRDVHLAVANDELRTWDPTNDNDRIKLSDVQKAPLDVYGSSGVRLVGTANNMLEGFRRGRFVRVYLNGKGWSRKTQPYGESLMGYGYPRMAATELVENLPKEYPDQFPFRTDFGNEHLPWFRVVPNELPPKNAEHTVIGELVSVDAEKRTGQVRAEKTGETVSFTLLPKGSAKYLNADASLADLPIGTRVRLSMFQDEKQAFTLASLIMDEFSYLGANTITHRVESVNLKAGEILVARQLAEVKNYNGDMERAPDVGRGLLRVDAETRVWKGDQAVKLDVIAPKDFLLVNLTSEQPGKPSRCTDIWIGEETHKLVSEKQKERFAATQKKLDAKKPDAKK